MRNDMNADASGESQGTEDVLSRAMLRQSTQDEDGEEALIWGALEKFPTYDRLRASILTSLVETECSKNVVHRLVDVEKLDTHDRQEFFERVLKVAEEDHEKFLRKIRSRIDEAGIELASVEVRFENLTVEADCFVGERALPTLPNAARNIAETALSCFGIKLAERTKLQTLKHTSGIIKPSRMTLLLGPPSCGKTTLLLALAGRLSHSLKASGEITYNGHKLNEFVAQKTSAYISQNDVHVAEMTVGETLDFSARCQGVGSRYDLLKEITRREKEAGVYPNADADLYMKIIELNIIHLIRYGHIMQILGLDECRDTIVGDQMLRGISGGQKKRVTTGEMIVGPSKVLFMDEISTGLDSSTTFQVVKCMQQIAHLTNATILMSLLQPAPETFNLFDDIVLLSEGQTVYHGPREHVLEFFGTNGFKCPERKGIADFLQEVTSKKDQEQYWADRTKPYRYVSVSEFAERFKHFHVGLQLQQELSVPYDEGQCPKTALVYDKNLVPRGMLLKANFYKEWLLIKRNSFFYVFKTVQIIIVAMIASTVFLKTRLHAQSEEDGAVYIGALVFGMIINTFNGYVEISLTIQRLPVFYKLRDLMFHPTWAFAIPHLLLRIPISLFESVVWTVTTYYTIGFAPEASRFFKQLLWVFFIQQMAAGMFRLIAGICRTMVISKTGGSLTLLLVFLLGGFIVPVDQIPIWWRWGYWISPLSYGYSSVAVNEMFASRWVDKLGKDNVTRLGVAVLKQFNIFPEEKWYWIGIAVLLGFTVVFNTFFVIALMYLNSFEKPQGIISQEQAAEVGTYQEKTEKAPRHRHRDSKDSLIQQNTDKNENSSVGVADKRGMVLPFTPLAMSFENVDYYVDMPPVMQEKGATEGKLRLLHELTGSFRPGVLTALMGVSGAGKTTLMDVLAGRKTRGYIEGDIRISGFPKKQETFARISGYCEQNDIHSPQIFVDEIMHLVELDHLKDAIVGIPGVTGLSTEQRKRLTIAVELVANPSIIFMDEPTSGLDARAAAIVMRTVRNTVDTGRTVVCTIHQPGIDIFESFDELLLMKRGGRVIYAGPLGQQSQSVINYFEAVPGVPKIKEQRNPAAWMLEVSSDATETRLGVDFGEHYKSTTLYQENKALVKELSIPPPSAKDLQFPTQYSQSTWSQFSLILWKQKWTYWRNPDYNLSRFFFTLAAALIISSIFWRVGTKRENSNDLMTVIGAMYASVLFLGINNCATIQPAVAIERTVFYRERAAGMYSVFPYAMAQVITEIPYVFVQTSYYTLIVYAMVSFEWKATKFLWFFFVNFFSFLYFTYYGMMTVSATPNLQMAAVFSNAFYYLFNLFSGFYIPGPKIPKWWIWYYWICPMAWTVYGLIVSQYGDIEDEITVEATSLKPSVRSYIAEHFGYRLDFMGEVALVLVGFTGFFAFMYAYCLKTLNFQKR
ncbi:pleiotropic drug resistance 1 [Perilla frutescens var. hirtella]|nr:pleiotropic drug resistance 1 [Perilla frutescens var. frutescens]KAH6800497.1 pleiotropic drug resistance 1 [Perilla frutescens var. hirtella]